MPIYDEMRATVLKPDPTRTFNSTRVCEQKVREFKGCGIRKCLGTGEKFVLSVAGAKLAGLRATATATATATVR
jgi:hypothetical protein